METNYLISPKLDFNSSNNLHLNDEDSKTIGSIKEYLGKFNVDYINEIAIDLLKQLKAKQIPINKEQTPYKIELIDATDRDHTIYNVNRIFLHCLALKSPYFGSLLDAKFREAEGQHLKISDISKEEFEMLIQNVFQPKLNEQNVHTLLVHSKRFLFSDLETKCENFFLDVLNKEDLDSFWKYLIKEESPEILNILAKIAPKHLAHLANLSKISFMDFLGLCLHKLDIKEFYSHSLRDQYYLEKLPPTLESLTFMGGITNGELLLLEKFNLKRLCFRYCDISDENLKILQKLKKLQYLSFIGCCKISDDGLKNLESLINLQELDFSNSDKITGEGIKKLQSLLNLKHLSLPWGEIINGKEEIKNYLLSIAQLPISQSRKLACFKPYFEYENLEDIEYEEEWEEFD